MSFYRKTWQRTPGLIRMVNAASLGKRSLTLYVLILLILMIGIGGTSFAAAYDPNLRWRTLETPHFRIVFHQGTEGLAHEAALAAEQAYAFWIEELNYRPNGKANLVIVDAADFANGFASLFPNKDITVYTSQARFADWANSRSESWMGLVVFHEYGHVVDLDKVSKVPAVFRSIFGRIILLNIRPTLFIEGIPTYGEFLRSGHARANDPRDEMYLREMTLEDDFPSFDRASSYYSRDEWMPPSMISHDYGPLFMRYLEERYGRGTIAALSERYTQNLLNLNFFFPNFGHALKKTVGISPNALYTDFKAWAKGWFAAQVERIETEGITESQRITRLSYWSDQPAWSPDGEWVVYRHSDPRRLTGLRILRPDGGDDRSLISGSIEFPTWSPDGSRLVYAKLDIYRHSYFYQDLYLYDVKTGKEERLTQGARAYYPALMPDGNRVLFARHRLGDRSPDLVILNLAIREVTPLKVFPNDTFVHSFEISPSGEEIALSIWKRGGYQDIYTMPIHGGELTPITQDRATDLDPTWSPDGEYIVFNSDRDGINNLYAYRVADGALLKVTNVRSGAFDPDVSPDGDQIAFVGYSIAGYDVHTMTFDPQRWTQVSYTHETLPQWPGYPETDYPIHRYNPLPSLVPKWWLPIIEENQAGFSTFGLDSLFQHSYTLEGGYNWVENRPFYALSYINNRFHPTLSLSLSGDSSGNQQRLEAAFPVVTRLHSSQRISVGYRRDEDLNTGTIDDTLFSTWWLTGVSGRDLFQDERRITLTGELSMERGTSMPQRSLIFDWREVFRLPVVREHRLAVKLSGGWSDTKDRFSLGGTAGTLLLRGFATGTLSGAQFISGSVEYRFPIVSIERGIELSPIFFDDLRGSLFIDGGTAGADLRAVPLNVGVGAELHLSTVEFYAVPLSFRLGVAWGLGEESSQVYGGLGTAF
ncbi:MAG: DPP IV N-terminal domain-containing protein [Candidatus Bipolaricaulia bacterium]